MKDFFDTWKFKILVAVAVFLVGIMAYAGANGRLTAAPQELLGVILTPFQKAGAVVSGGVGAMWEKYASIDKVMEQNEQLTAENAELRQQMVDYDRIKAENEAYKALANIQEKNSNATYVSGFVIGRDPLDEFGGFTLDKGTADGVAVNDAVISDRGYLLGILKLNYKNGYTHYTETVEGAPVNSIIQQRACLPTQSGKVEEGALVDLTDYSMRLLEKKYDIDGHKEFYLSTVVFQYTTAQPEKKKLQAIQEAAVQAVQENYAETPHVEAQVAMMIANQAADNDNQVSIQQVRQQLEEEYPLAAVPFDDYVEKSDVLDSAAQPVTVTPARIRRMESRSLRTANGIEVKIPTELLNAESEVEFLHADDGSISLLIKNVIL